MDQTPDGDSSGKMPEKSPWVRRLREVIEILALTVVLALGVKSCVVDAVHVPSPSMENTLLPGDFLLVNKFIYGPATPRFLPVTGTRIPFIRLPALAGPRLGDVIVFKAPDEEAGPYRTYVKRIIGLPGDTVMFRQGALFINGTPGTLPYEGRKGGGSVPDFGPVVVPRAGTVLDLREDHASVWEPIIWREGHVVGRTTLGTVLVDGRSVRTYRTEQDHYFVVGDNINDSLDSRNWGFVPFDHILGKALLIYWSVDPRTGVRWGRIGRIVR